MGRSPKVPAWLEPVDRDKDKRSDIEEIVDAMKAIAHSKEVRAAGKELWQAVQSAVGESIMVHTGPLSEPWSPPPWQEIEKQRLSAVIATGSKTTKTRRYIECPTCEHDTLWSRVAILFDWAVMVSCCALCDFYEVASLAQFPVPGESGTGVRFENGWNDAAAFVFEDEPKKWWHPFRSLLKRISRR